MKLRDEILEAVVIPRVSIFTLRIHTGHGIYRVSTQKAGTGGRVDEEFFFGIIPEHFKKRMWR